MGPDTGLASARGLFTPTVTYLDTASVGLPPSTAVAALTDALATWQAGRAAPPSYDAFVDEARASFARLVHVSPDTVAVGSQASFFAGTVAASLPSGSRVVAVEDDFTSVLFPFLSQARRDVEVRLVAVERLADAVDAGTSLVAFSAVRSSDGRLVDLDAVEAAAAAHGAATFVDATQACGWLPFDAGRWDYVTCAAYKWLLCPRGVAFFTARPEGLDRLSPIAPGWYAGADVWTSLYGGPLRLATTARRHDLSPVWLSWVGAVPALRLLEQVGVNAVQDHDVRLANRFRAGLGMAPSDSAMVSVTGVPDAAERLVDAGVRASVRAGGLRAAFHLYNTDEDVDRSLTALRIR